MKRFTAPEPGPASMPTPVFGEREPGAEYVDRPGSYVILRDEAGRLATAKTSDGVFLPGGGKRQSESAADAAIRETREEIGLAIRIVRHIGAADELIHAASEGAHYRKRCEFFAAELATNEPGAGEVDHQLDWLDEADAERLLSHGSHRWAVRQVRGARSASQDARMQVSSDDPPP